MSIYNLVECSKNYRKTKGILWNYYRDKPNFYPLNNYNANPVTNLASFKYKISITGSTYNVDEHFDPTFNEVNRLFVLSFENEDDRTSYSKYYTPKVEIKDLNVLIDGKIFFDTLVKNK